MTKKPRAWFSEHNVLCFRPDLTEDEIAELDEMMSEAFNAGLRSGYAQGYERGKEKDS